MSSFGVRSSASKLEYEIAFDIRGKLRSKKYTFTNDFILGLRVACANTSSFSERYGEPYTSLYTEANKRKIAFMLANPGEEVYALSERLEYDLPIAEVLQLFWSSSPLDELDWAVQFDEYVPPLTFLTDNVFSNLDPPFVGYSDLLDDESLSSTNYLLSYDDKLLQHTICHKAPNIDVDSYIAGICFYHSQVHAVYNYYAAEKTKPPTIYGHKLDDYVNIDGMVNSSDILPFIVETTRLDY